MCMYMQLGNTVLLTLAAKRGGGLLQSFGDFCPSVRPSVLPSVFMERVVSIRGLPMQVSRNYGTGRVVMLSPTQWCSSVRAAVVAILCLAGQLSMQ